jgi:glycine betaine/choline ABC-type transport system substrate-binding protein
LTAILKKEATNDPDAAYDRVRDTYYDQYDLIWLKPFGFDNTYTITARQDAANENNWNTIGDLVSDAPRLHAGFTSEFMEREDGYPGLKQIYHIDFGKVSDLESSLMYEALAKAQVDVICGFATDGRIVRYNLKPLQDNVGFFPPYEAAPVIRRVLLNTRPELRPVLEKLAGRLDNATMQQLNSRVDQGQMDVPTAARDFLREMSIAPEDQNEAYNRRR